MQSYYDKLRLKILREKEAEYISTKLREQRKKIVFTNGCFDIIHKGHIKLLFDAKSLGDVLFVGLNSDLSIKRIKGEKRPIIPQKERAIVLSSISAVDFIVIFEEDTPEKIIKSIKPDIIVKGEDWEEERIVGADFVKERGGKIIRIKLEKGNSTTQIIETILERYKS